MLDIKNNGNGEIDGGIFKGCVAVIAIHPKLHSDINKPIDLA